VREQCDNTPTITADGSKIDTINASKQRWIAVSQDLLYSPRRFKLFVKDKTDNRFQGKIHFGDTVWIESPNPRINGKWVVHDLMSKRYRNAIDFLQTTGDDYLYNNDKLWDGKFKIISVYKINRNINTGAPKLGVPPVNIIINYVEKPRYPQMIICDSINYFNYINKIFLLDEIKDRCRKNFNDTKYKYWDLRFRIEGEKNHMGKIEHQIDSMEIELQKYKNEMKSYQKFLKKLKK
jgi:hypothetical protein